MNQWCDSVCQLHIYAPWRSCSADRALARRMSALFLVRSPFFEDWHLLSKSPGNTAHVCILPSSVHLDLWIRVKVYSEVLLVGTALFPSHPLSSCLSTISRCLNCPPRASTAIHHWYFHWNCFRNLTIGVEE